MNAVVKKIGLSALVLAVLLGGGNAYAQSLTGLCQFDTNPSGDFGAQAVWNTALDAGIYNLYVIEGAPGPFINSGNGLSTEINVPLTPGVHSFTVHGEPGGDTALYFAINLFFDGNRATPGISVYGPSDTAPGGLPNGGLTVNLDGDDQTVPGANTLTTTSNGMTITLSNFVINTDSSIDLVSPFSTSPSATNDYVATFDLTVTALEPVPTLPTAAIPLLALLLGTVAWVAYRKRGAAA